MKEEISNGEIRAGKTTSKRRMQMKKIIVAIVAVLVMGMHAFASLASLPAKAVIKGGEKAAVKRGLRTAG